MTIERVELLNLFPHPQNPRHHDANQVSAMIASLTRFGQIRPIVADENGMILVGHCIFMALQEMKEPQAAVFRILGLDEKEKKRLLLADNKVGDLGQDNFEELWDLIKSLEGDYNIPGYDDTVLTELLTNVDEAIISTGSDLAEKSGTRMTDGASMGTSSAERFTEISEQIKKKAKYTVGPGGETVIVCPHCGKAMSK